MFRPELSLLLVLFVLAPISSGQSAGAPANDPSAAASTSSNNWGMTWGWASYVEDEQELFHVGCSGTPVVPPYAPYQGSSGSCNPYEGDTPCSHSIPILCISPCRYYRPCYPMVCGPHAMTKEFYCGWSEGMLRLTEPVQGSLLTSLSVADGICSKTFGPGFRMANHGDGKYVVGMDEHNYCQSTWPLGSTSSGGWGFYGYGVKGPRWTRFWVAVNDQNGNCWN
jgi:hypothetical protein